MEFRILLLDDESSIVQLFTRIFRCRGHDVTGCLKPGDACAAVDQSVRSRQPFDMAFFGFNLGESVNGVEVAKTVFKADPRLPIVIASAMYRAGRIGGWRVPAASAYLCEPVSVLTSWIKDTGVVGGLSKPTDGAELIAVAERIAGLSRAQGRVAPWSELRGRRGILVVEPSFTEVGKKVRDYLAAAGYPDVVNAGADWVAREHVIRCGACLDVVVFGPTLTTGEVLDFVLWMKCVRPYPVALLWISSGVRLDAQACFYRLGSELVLTAGILTGAVEAQKFTGLYAHAVGALLEAEERCPL